MNKRTFSEDQMPVSSPCLSLDDLSSLYDDTREIGWSQQPFDYLAV